jgi:cysteine desulfurase/selenocysteine lyase
MDSGHDRSNMWNTEMTTFDSPTVRALFPGAEKSVYLDVASRGLMPGDSMEIAQRHISDRIFGVADKTQYFEQAERARSLFARLIGASAPEVAITKNVSEGLNIAASSLRWKEGDEVLACSELEHPNNLYPWRNLERQGVRFIDLPSRAGLMPVDDLIARLTPRTRIVAVSAVTFRPGYRTDLKPLGAACRANGTLLVVDGAQSVGITHIDVAEDCVDVLATSCQKGLCSVYGMGFLYVREAVAQEMQPAYLARFGVDIAKTHEADYDPGPIALRRGALRFDVGNYNFMAAELTVNSLDKLLDIGIERIDAHVTDLATRLTQELSRLGIELVEAPERARANMVCVAITQPRLAARGTAIDGALKAMNVRAAVRGRYARFSFHLYNDLTDVERTARAMASLV